MSNVSQLAYLNCKTSFSQLTVKHLLRSVFCMCDQIAHLSWPALCHIIFTLTITMWVCIIRLSLLRLPSLRFTSDSPTDQTSPFSGDNSVRMCVSRFHLRGFERWERAVRRATPSLTGTRTAGQQPALQQRCHVLYCVLASELYRSCKGRPPLNAINKSFGANKTMTSLLWVWKNKQHQQCSQNKQFHGRLRNTCKSTLHTGWIRSTNTAQQRPYVLTRDVFIKCALKSHITLATVTQQTFMALITLKINNNFVSTTWMFFLN